MMLEHMLQKFPCSVVEKQVFALDYFFFLPLNNIYFKSAQVSPTEITL